MKLWRKSSLARTGRRGKRGGRRALRIGAGAAQGRCPGDRPPASGHRIRAVRRDVRRHRVAHGLRVAAARRRRADAARRCPRRLDPVGARRHRRPQRRRAGDLGAGDVGLRQSAPAARSAGCRASKIVSALPDLKYDDVRDQARGGQDLRLGQARLEPARARPRQPARHSRARVPGRGAPASIRRARRRRTSWAMPASTMPGSPASSATSTSSCRAARRCSLPSIFACSAWSSARLHAPSRSSRRSAPPPSSWTRPTARSSPWLRCRPTIPTRPRPSPTRRCSIAPRSASTSRARPSRSSTRRWRSTPAR